MKRVRVKWCLMLAASLVVGQAVAEDKVMKVQVEGMSDLRAQLQQLDARLSLLTQSAWEYRFLQRNRFNSDIARDLEALGRDGWELVNVTLEEGFILKRRVTR